MSPALSAGHVPSWPAAAFRVVFCLVALRDVIKLWSDVSFLWPVGFTPSPWTPSRIVLPIWIAALTALLLGVATRPAAAVNLAVTVVALGPAKAAGTYWQTADTMLFLGAWLLLLLPVDARWSLRSRRRSATMPAAVHTLAGVLLCVIYLDSGVRKLLSPMWRSGLGIWTPASLPEAVIRHWPMLDVEPFALALGWGTIAFELLFPLAWFAHRHTRTAIWLCGIGFHLGGYVFFPFHSFSLTMLALHVLAFPPDLARRLDPAKASGAQQGVPWFPARVVALAAVGWLAGHAALTLGIGAEPTQLRAKPGNAFLKTFPLTGAQHYGVFADGLFDQQTYQLDVVWPDGPLCRSLGAHSRAGLNATDLVDRRWELWFKRTQAAEIPTSDGERNLLRFVSDAGARRGTLVARPQLPSTTRWLRGLYDRNIDAEWVEVGTVDTTAEEGEQVTWLAADQPTMGQQVEAALDAATRPVDFASCRPA